MSNPTFVDSQERELFQEAFLGEKVRLFLLEDPVGQYLHHRAKQQIAQAEVDALAVDPDGFRGWFQSRRKLRQIRQRAAVAKALIDFLAEAISNGRNAERELDEYRQPQ
jgi:uncharacterized sporulation protein YeaH/YhbH (DUF444 family)